MRTVLTPPTNAARHLGRAAAAIAVIAGLVPTACASKPSARSAVAIAAEYDAKMVAVRDAAIAEFHWAACPAPPKNRCGLLVDSYQSDAVERFVAKVCGGSVTDNCVRAYRGQFMKHALTRYTLASADDVTRICEHDAKQCASLQDVELLFLASHNAAIHDRAMRAIDRLFAEEAIEERTTWRYHSTYALLEEDKRRASLRADLDQSAKEARTVPTAAQAPSGDAGAPSVSSSAIASTKRTCTNDRDCALGEICGIAAGSSAGECAKRGTERGAQNRARKPGPDGGGGGKQNCTFDMDCEIGLICGQPRCF